MRRTIAARLTQSKQQIPHVYYTRELGMDAVAQMCRRDSTALARVFHGRGQKRTRHINHIVRPDARPLQHGGMQVCLRGIDRRVRPAFERKLPAQGARFADEEGARSGGFEHL